MTEWTTLRVPQDAADIAREAKRDGETWGDYLRRCADAEPVVEMTEGDVRRIARDEVEKNVNRRLQEQF